MLRPPSQQPKRILRLGNWRLDAGLDEVSLGGRTAKLEPRMTRLLLVLAERPGNLVTTQELLDQVWPDLTVTQNSLYQVIAQLRRILSADAETSTFIATVARKGYRLVAPAEWEPPNAGTSPLHSSAISHGPCSVAILPFTPHNLPASHDYLVEVLLDNLIAELARYPMLTVISRGTMSMYKERPADVTAVAGDLGVRFVAHGHLVVIADKLEIAAWLVDNSSSIQAWSGHAQTVLESGLTPMRDAIGRFAREIQFRIVDKTVQEPVPPTARGTDNQSALRAWVELYCKPQTRQTNARALSWARQALEHDDTSAVAWNALAYTEWRAAQFGWSESGSSMDRALQHVQHAIMLAPRDPDAHYTHALIAHTAREQERAEAALRHCLALNPSYAPALGLLALVTLVQGRREAALDLCHRAFALSPYEPLRVIWHCVRAWAALEVDDAADALVHAQRGLAVNPDYPICHLTAAIAAHRLGRTDLAGRSVSYLRTATALSTLAEIIKRMPILHVEPYRSRIPAELESMGISGTHD